MNEVRKCFKKIVNSFFLFMRNLLKHESVGVNGNKRSVTRISTTIYFILGFLFSFGLYYIINYFYGHVDPVIEVDKVMESEVDSGITKSSSDSIIYDKPGETVSEGESGKTEGESGKTEGESGKTEGESDKTEGKSDKTEGKSGKSFVDMFFGPSEKEVKECVECKAKNK